MLNDIKNDVEPYGYIRLEASEPYCLSGRCRRAGRQDFCRRYGPRSRPHESWKTTLSPAFPCGCGRTRRSFVSPWSNV